MSKRNKHEDSRTYILVFAIHRYETVSNVVVVLNSLIFFKKVSIQTLLLNSQDRSNINDTISRRVITFPSN